MTRFLSLWKGEVDAFPPPPKPVIPTILEQVALEHEVTVADLKSPRAGRRLAFARFDAMARLRDVKMENGRSKFSTAKIGEVLGDRDHTTVIHGLRRWKQISTQFAGQDVKMHWLSPRVSAAQRQAEAA